MTNHRFKGHVFVVGVVNKFKNISSVIILLIIEKINIVAAEMIDPNETILEDKYTIKKENIPTRQIIGE